MNTRQYFIVGVIMTLTLAGLSLGLLYDNSKLRSENVLLQKALSTSELNTRQLLRETITISELAEHLSPDMSNYTRPKGYWSIGWLPMLNTQGHIPGGWDCRFVTETWVDSSGIESSYYEYTFAYENHYGNIITRTIRLPNDNFFEFGGDR